MGRPISETDCTGWQTTTVEDASRTGSYDQWEMFLTGGHTPGARLRNQVHSVGWTTPAARDWKDTGTDTTPRSDNGKERLDMLTGWPTPMAGTQATATYNEAGNTDSSRKTQALLGVDLAGSGITPLPLWGPARLTAHGTLLTGSGAGTVSGGQLNPDLSRWLMGLPEEWARSMPGWQDWQMWQVLTALASSEPKPTG